MGKLGVSLYPEKTAYEADVAYLERAKEYGFTRLFINLLLFGEPDPTHIERIKKTTTKAHGLGFETILDVNPRTFEVLGIKPQDLGYFEDWKIAGIRLDMGFTGKEEALLTKNEYGFLIEINMSNDNHYLDLIMDHHPRRSHLIGSHNFFPQAYTGLEEAYFLACSKKFQAYQLRTAAFVTSQQAEIGPWPLQEGLCTLETHRRLPLAIQVAHMKSLEAVDDIIIGNAYVSDAELKQAASAFHAAVTPIGILPANDLTELEEKIIFEELHTYRGDYSSYMIRSSMTRLKYYKHELPVNNENQPIERGDILLLNQEYGQYKGEVQIALKSRPNDPRINKIGKIAPEYLPLLDGLKPFDQFTFIDLRHS